MLNLFLNNIFYYFVLGPCYYHQGSDNYYWIKKSFNSGSFLHRPNIQDHGIGINENITYSDKGLSDASVCGHLSRNEDNAILALVTATQNDSFCITRSKELRMQYITTTDFCKHDSLDKDKLNIIDKKNRKQENFIPDAIDKNIEIPKPTISKKELIEMKKLLSKLSSIGSK